MYYNVLLSPSLLPLCPSCHLLPHTSNKLISEGTTGHGRGLLLFLITHLWCQKYGSQLNRNGFNNKQTGALLPSICLILSNTEEGGEHQGLQILMGTLMLQPTATCAQLFSLCFKFWRYYFSHEKFSSVESISIEHWTLGIIITHLIMMLSPHQTYSDGQFHLLHSVLSSVTNILTY